MPSSGKRVNDSSRRRVARSSARARFQRNIGGAAVLACTSLLAIIAVACAVVAGTRADASGAPTYQFEPAASAAYVGGGPHIVQLMVSGVQSSQPLDAYRVELRYDPGALSVTLYDGALLRSTGNNVSCAVSYLASGLAALTCDASGAAARPHGDGELAVVRFEPASALRLTPSIGNGILTSLSVSSSDGTALFDATGAVIPVQSTVRAFVVVQALEGDVTRDCAVDLGDVQAVVSRAGSTAGGAGYDAYYDVEPAGGDDDIDLNDVQFVAGRAGNLCETPTPSPTPTPTGTPAPRCFGFAEFVLMLGAWNSIGPPSPSSNWNVAADFNGDNAVNFRDLVILLAGWNCRTAA